MKIHTVAALLSATLACGADSIPAGRIRAAAEKGLARIQASQNTWYQKQSCQSCHHQHLPELAFRSAREHGLHYDEAAARAAAAKSFAVYTDLARAVEYTHIFDPVVDDAWRLVAANAAGVQPNIVTAVYARQHAAVQQTDGHWTTLDIRPPSSYSSFSATAISIRAIQSYHHPSLTADAEARIARARRWLEQADARNTEDHSSQLLGLAWAGAGRSEVAKLARALVDIQQNDGGWASLDGRPSDVYSTAHALVALAEAGGVAASEPAFQRGIRFLLDSQQPDGSWHVVSRLYPPAPVSPPYFESGYPYGHDQFISIIGASWAVMALADALPPANRPPANHDPFPFPEAMPDAVEPWVETVLFGTSAQLRGLLDRKLDPNATTKAGGLTALMMAVPDLEKTKLLLEHGANVNARSKTRYSALMVASEYPGSAPVMQLLLAHGAALSLPKRAGTPLFNANPVVLASIAGHAEAIGLLHRAGAGTEDKMIFGGFAPATALTMVVQSGNAAVTSALIENGARVDHADDDDITPLAWAAISGHVDVARLLLDHGAQVNHLDKKGMTPLLYAASIDFGDAGMIDLLLKSGADPKARTKEGLTALDLARKYKHSHLLASLGDQGRR